MRNLRSELESWEGWPEAWKPKEGEVLVGKIEQYDIGHSAYGPVRTVIIKDEATGERVSLWLTSTVLLNLFNQHKPRPQERIGLKYLGKDEVKGYHRYHLVVDREEQIDFSPLGVTARQHKSQGSQRHHCDRSFYN